MQRHLRTNKKMYKLIKKQLIIFTLLMVAAVILSLFNFWIGIALFAASIVYLHSFSNAWIVADGTDLRTKVSTSYIIISAIAIFWIGLSLPFSNVIAILGSTFLVLRTVFISIPNASNNEDDGDDELEDE